MILAGTPQSAEAVAGHYDELDPFYREVWGEHLHHGYWATGQESPAQAAEALVAHVAERLRIAPGLAICDIGSGYGATAQWLAETYGVSVTGVTISATQALRASRRSATRGKLVFDRKNWLQNDFVSGSFDRAYAIESTEHMPDKQRFFNETLRTLRPGGLLTVCAWISRTDPQAWEVKYLLEPICREGRLPGLGDQADYEGFIRLAGFTPLSVDDLSSRVARTWPVCLRRATRKLFTDGRYRRFVLDRNARNRVFAVTMLRLLLAYRTGSLRYCVFTAQKPPTGA
ncbi:MAG: class I SAM-dependent methyltransferase [Pseudomonadota bacterium]|nr:class I SAM-dependent methyltransferase [Pseudomonadota bacterium]